MGKVRNMAGTCKHHQRATNEPSTSLKKKKCMGENKTKQDVKFKIKRADAAGSHGSFKGNPGHGDKVKLQKDLVFQALREKSYEGEPVEKQFKILSAETISKAKMSQRSPRVKKKKRQKQVHEDEYMSPSVHSSCSKKTLVKTDDIPLAVEMPEAIDDADTTLSDLNTSSESDGILNMDTSDNADSRPVVPLNVTDSYSTEAKTEVADIPLAVVMPGSALTTEKVRKEKEVPKIDTTKSKLTQDKEDDKSGDLNQSLIGIDVSGHNKSSENPVGSSKRISENEQVLENVKVHLVGRSVALELTHPAKFFIFGQVEVQVLCGEIIILGYAMSKKSGAHVVSSLRGSSFLSIRTSRPRSGGNAEVDLPPGLQDEAALGSLIAASHSHHVWALLREGNQEFLEYIRTFLEFPISLQELKSNEITPLSEAQESLSCVFQPELALGKRINELASWKFFSETIIKEQKSCTVLCGGKGVGKSTLLRFLVNRILSSGQGGARGVVLLDFDPGQAELTPPGCVSVSLIKKPLLGPNYTHLQQTERCVYVGEFDVVQCLERYINASAYIIQFFKQSPHLSSFHCIVNTMGFTRGIGVTIMGLLLKLLQPTRVVQIESRRQRNNYPFRLTSNRVKTHSKRPDSRCIRESLQLALQVLPPEENKDDLHYEFVLLQSAAEIKNSKDENVWGMKPRVSRDAVILSYFSPLVQPPSFSILDDIPFSCSLGTLFLCVAHEKVPPDLTLNAINGNMVALSTIDPTTPDVFFSQDPDMPRVLTKVPMAPCLGFGIVRAVDMKAKMLYLTTPLKEEVLCLANCLVFGVVNLPTSVYLKSTAPGLVPYVSSGHHPDVLAQ